MTTLLDIVRADAQEKRLAAHKDRANPVLAVEATLLSTLLGESVKVGKDAADRPSTDAEVLKVMTKFKNGVDESLGLLSASKTALTPEQENMLWRLRIEQPLLDMYVDRYTPKQMTANELQAVVDALVAVLPEKKPQAMGAVMKALKEKYEGQYDGQLASKLVKTALA